MLCTSDGFALVPFVLSCHKIPTTSHEGPSRRVECAACSELLFRVANAAVSTAGLNARVANCGLFSDASLMASQSYPVPTSAAHIVDRVESGGARVEETLLRFNMKYQTLFFAAHLTCMAAGVLGALTSVASFELASLVNSLFLM